jgi:hypothetical protein
MQNLLDELKRELKVELLSAVLETETVSEYHNKGTKLLVFPDRLVYFKIDFSNDETEYPDIHLLVIAGEDGSSKTVWSIQGLDLARRHLREVVRYDILPYLEDNGIELKDIIGLYVSWLEGIRTSKELDAVQKTVDYQAIPNDDDNKYLIVFRTIVSEKKQKDDIYEFLKYSLSFDKIKYNVTTPFPITLDERARAFQKMADEIESFLNRVNEEVGKILNG